MTTPIPSPERLGQLGRPENREILTEFMQSLDFTGLSVVETMRTFLQACPLVGETQEQDRVLQAVAARFVTCNPFAYAHVDVVHRLLYAMILLNTDLHSEGTREQRKMTQQEFLRNTRATDSDNTDAAAMDAIPDKDLISIYKSIRSEPLQMVTHKVSPQPVEPAKETPGSSRSSFFRSISRHSGDKRPPAPTLTSLVAPYVHGSLSRKHVLETFRTRAPNRRWKPFHAVLHGSDLYLYPPLASNQSLSGPSDVLALLQLKPFAFHPLRHAHAAALPAPGYSLARSYVFQLILPTDELHLFQVSSKEELQRWVVTINWWAARESREPLPQPIGSGVFGFEKHWLLSFVPGGSEEIEREERRLQKNSHSQHKLESPTDPSPFMPVRHFEDVRESLFLDWKRPNFPFVPASLHGTMDEVTLTGKSSVVFEKPLGIREEGLIPVSDRIASWKSRLNALRLEMGNHLLSREIMKQFLVGHGIQELILAEKRKQAAKRTDHSRLATDMHAPTLPSSAGIDGKKFQELVDASATKAAAAIVISEPTPQLDNATPQLTEMNCNETTPSEGGKISVDRRSSLFSSRRSWKLFSSSTFSVNTQMSSGWNVDGNGYSNASEFDDEPAEEGQYWKPSLAVKVAGSSIVREILDPDVDELSPRTSSLDNSLPPHPQQMAIIRLPAPSHAVVCIPQLPQSLVDCMMRPPEDPLKAGMAGASPFAALADFPKLNKKLAMRMDRNWIRRFLYLQWELCKAQTYLSALQTNPRSKEEGGVISPVRPPLFPT